MVFMWSLHHTVSYQHTLPKRDKIKERQPSVWWTGKTFTLLCDDTDWYNCYNENYQAFLEAISKKILWDF